MIKDNVAQIRRRIEQAAARCGRDPASVRLLTVSKTVSAERVKEAIDAGIRLLGENYIQEAREKIATLRGSPAVWHLIGHLQTNKARFAVGLFDLIHSVDSIKLARELDKQALRQGKVQPILIQVNIAEEKSKSGITEQAAPQLIREVSRCSNLSVKGLMTMPPFFNAPEKVRPYFKALRQLAGRIAAMNIDGVTMTELSMGMTGDFEVAIEEGATIVRVGTAIFGERQ
ncbi:MAG: YggS family pyridoxal phosphate-dependent enzyme [Desulfobacterales bacterium]